MRGATGARPERALSYARAMFVRLEVDYENPSSEWWESGGRDLWEGVAESADASGIGVEESIADSWLQQAASVPGWHDGPEYAPHPIAKAAINEDEEF